MFRPKQVKTLSELIDQLNHYVANGVPLNAPIFHSSDAGLVHPTLVSDDIEPGLWIEPWTDDELKQNSKHCDSLGVEA